MRKEEILMELKKVFNETLNIEENLICLDTVAEDVENWDSLGHLRLILAIEGKFNVKFDINDIKKLFSIKYIVEAIQSLYDK